MRKYQQLFILALAIVSFICFLIYKHEYDRLRYVVENLEIFGNPPPSSVPSILDKENIDNGLDARQRNHLLDHPLGVVGDPESDKVIETQSNNVNNRIAVNEHVIQSPVASNEQNLNAKKS